MKAMCLILIIYSIYNYVQGSIIYVNKNSTDVLRCPYKADIGSTIDWSGPPSLTRYTLGIDINPNLPHSDRISVVGQTDQGEYNLQISNLQQSDIGQYQCSGSVGGSFETDLLTLYFAVPPVAGPSLSRNPSGPLFVGNTIVLKCEVIGGIPLAKISWHCDGFFGEHNTSTDKTIESTVNLNLRQSDNNKKCTCVANHPSWTSQKSVDIVLNVFYAPDYLPSIQQSPPGGIFPSSNVTLTCSVKGGNPPAILNWNCTGETTNRTTDTTAIYSVSFTVNKDQNKAICACAAFHPVTSYIPVIDHILDVYYVPDTNPQILQTPPGGILTGNVVKLTCFVPGGNPIAILSWNCSGTEGNNTAGNTASYSITLSVDKSYNNKICRCTADHVISTYKPTVQKNLVVYYAPDDPPSIQQTPIGGVITGCSVMLTCSVKGGNPAAILSWNCTGDTTNSTTDTAANYSVSFPVSKTQNKAICACSASHPVTSYTPVIYQSLDVYFAPDTYPIIQRKPVEGIISGNKVNLTCTASGGNPLATLSWNCSGTNTKYTTANTVSHSVEFTVDKSDNNKLCICSGFHPVTSYIPTVENRLLVYFEPFLDTTRYNTPTNIDISENDDLFITVSVKSNPYPIIQWSFIAEANSECYNSSVINSTSINVGLHSSSNISIDNLKKNEFGQYIFMATNVVGIFLRKFSVYGKEKPMPPSYVHVVCKSTTAVVIFKQTVIGNLQEKLYIQYEVEGQDMTSIKVHMNDTNQAIEYTVTGLNPGRKYNFYILAVNLFGQTRSNQVKCLTDTFLNGEDMLAFNKDNSSMLGAGIASLVVGLLLFVAATLFIFRKRFKKTYTRASKSEEYSDLQTSNPAFQDPYTSIQNPIESRHHQELIANTYEECGNASEGAAYQNIENMKSGHKNAEKNIGIYDNMKI